VEGIREKAWRKRMGDGGRARATAGRGQGECPGRGGGASQHDGGVWKSGVRSRTAASERAADAA